ncbi:hypothetical protein DUNSADRAFT_15497 [Dunaliella salina]|uniref:Uncharacterized protein n=1 Tax=Dunaliella salina TaxID=3046 RepID=A0ABQ7H1Q4_DUNSA|nr:hypothetical protein DUNSADRAFT_15497 [Dunaliella salina]|eukprot:KAF5840787.1 hypothetical protein DUNSADRAFT_15497 [Dunaliella salina]
MQVGLLVSGLQSLEDTLGLLAAEVRTASATQQQQQQQQQQGAPCPRSPAHDAQQSVHSSVPQHGLRGRQEEGEGAGEGVGESSTDGGASTNAFSFGVGAAGVGRGDDMEQGPDTPAVLKRKPPSPRACASSAGNPPPSTASSSATTQSTSTASSDEPSLRGIPQGPSHNGDRAQGALQQAGLVPQAIDTDPEGTNTTSTLLAERLLAARARTEKWKARARHLGQQLALLGAGAATREAAVAERVAAAEGAAEECAHRLRAEVQRLEAALVGTESARKELEQRTTELSVASEAAATATATAAKTDAAEGGAPNAPWGVSTVPPTLPTSTPGSGIVGAARVAELSARCAALERQLEAERAQGATRCTSLISEASSLRGALAQEQNERARLLGGMRGALTGLNSCGDVEGRLRKELLDAHQAAAAAHAAQERTEAQADAWRAEARVLRERLQTSEKERLGALQTLEARLLAAERYCARLADTYTARTEDLAGRLSAFASTASAAMPNGCTEQLQQQQRQLVLLNEEMASMAARLTEFESGARHQDAAGRWGWVAQAARYQRAIKGALQELEAVEHKAAQEKAELQAHLATALEGADATACRLRECQMRAAEAAHAAEVEHQRMASRHLSHISELQSRIEEERRAMADEAAVHAESLARSREGHAAAAGSAALAQAQAQYAQALEQSEARVLALQKQLEDLGHAFRAYQAARAAEVSALEERVVALISSGSPSPDQLPQDALHEAKSAAPPRQHSSSSRSATAAKYGGSRCGGVGGGGRAASMLPCMHAVHNVARSSNGRRYTRAGAAGHMPMRGCSVCSRLLGRVAGPRTKQPRFCAACAREARQKDADAERDGNDVRGPSAKPPHLCAGCAQETQQRDADAGRDGNDVQGARADQEQELLCRHWQAAAAGGGQEGWGRGWGGAPTDWRGLQDVVAAVAEERVDAARREVLFERLHRQRAEASAHAAQKALASARLRLRFLQRETQRATAREAAELQREKDGWVGGEAHAAVVNDLVACREALRSARAESARRQRALHTLQSLANAGLLRSPQTSTTMSPYGTAAATAAAGGKGAKQGGDGGVDPTIAHAARAAAVAAAAAANAASGVAAEVSANMDMYHGTGGDVQQAVHGFGGLRALIDDAAARTATAALLERAAQKHHGDGSDDPFCIAAETATAAAAAAAAALEAEHVGREAAEAKLKEARASGDSKNARIKELKRCTEELEAELKEAQQSDARAALAVLEGRIKQANAAVARKDGLIKELRDRLEAAKQQAAAAASQQAAATEAGEAGQQQQNDAERQARTVARLRGDLAKREAALKAALAELEKERQEAAEAAHASWEAGAQEAKALRQAAVAMQHRSCELMQAVRTLLRLVQRSSSAAATAAQLQKGGGAGAPPTQQQQQQQQQQQHTKQALEEKGKPIGTGLSEADIASLTSLSLSEVQDLLGPSTSSGPTRQPTRNPPEQQQPQQQCGAIEGRGQPGPLEGHCDELLSVLEATLLPNGVGMGADVSAGARQMGAHLMQWDPANLKLLLEAAEQQVQAVVC